MLAAERAAISFFPSIYVCVCGTHSVTYAHTGLTSFRRSFRDETFCYLLQSIQYGDIRRA